MEDEINCFVVRDVIVTFCHRADSAGFDNYNGDLLRSTTAQEMLARGGLSFVHKVSLLKPGFIGVSIEHFAGNVKLPRRSSEENTERIAATHCGFRTRVDSLRISVFLE